MREGLRPGFAGGLNVELLQDLRGQADVGGIEESSSDLGLRALGRMSRDRIKQNVCQHTARSWTSSRLNRSSARKPVRLATTFRSCCARRSNSAELLSRDRRYATTNALTDIPDSAARTRANRYTSSGNVTVRFFTGTPSHRNTGSFSRRVGSGPGPFRHRRGDQESPLPRIAISRSTTRGNDHRPKPRSLPSRLSWSLQAN